MPSGSPPVHSNRTNDGNHGGILILHDTAHGINSVENYRCGYQAFLWEAKARVYFKTNETIQAPPIPNSWPGS